MTLSEQINHSIQLLQDAVADIQAAEKGKIKPGVRARRSLLTATKSLNALRKEILELSKAEKAKREEEKLSNPKKTYAKGFAVKTKS